MTDDVLGGEAPDHDVAAQYEERALDAVRSMFTAQPRRVLFARQVEVLHEGPFFHWVTKRAITTLIDEGLIVSEKVPLANGSDITLLWHRSYRYPRRESKAVVELVDEYSAQAVGSAIGSHAELLLIEVLALNGFQLLGRDTREFGGLVWTETGHDLDMVVRRDEVGYGIEVKNQLGYMDHDELKIKTRMSLHLGVRPMFVVRMMPKTWIWEVERAGGFVLVLKYQLYPPVLKDLAQRVRHATGLPVDAPRRLQANTTERFANWHLRNV